MAEVLGVSAGVVGLAGFTLQILDSTAKLRHFCSSSKEAPENLSLLLEEVALFSDLVSELADEEQRLSIVSQGPHSAQPAAVKRATAFCQRAASHTILVLASFQNVLQKKGTRQALAKIRFALNEKQVTQSLEQLERAKSLLSLAQQCLLQ